MQQSKKASQPTRLVVSQLHRTSGKKLGSSGGSLLSLGLLGGLLSLGGGGLVLLGGIGAGIGLGGVRRGPEGEVVAQQLHDEGAVAVRLLGQGVELGDGVVKGLLGKVASTVGRVQDLVVEDGEVQRKTQADGVGRGELSLGDVGGILRVRLSAWCPWGAEEQSGEGGGETNLVGVVGSGGGNLALLARGKLGEVAVVVTLPVRLVSGCVAASSCLKSVERTSCGKRPWTRQWRHWG